MNSELNVLRINEISKFQVERSHSNPRSTIIVSLLTNSILYFYNFNYTTLYHLWFRGRGVLDVGDVEVGALLVALQPRHVDPEAAGDDALAAPPRLPLAPLGRGRGHRLVGARPHPHRAVALLTLLEPPVWGT